MALLFMDGFDHYGNPDSQVVYKGWTYDWTATWDMATVGRFGYGYCFRVTGNYGWIKKNLEVNKSTIYFGGAIKKTGLNTPVVSTTYNLLEFRDESDVRQVALCINANYGINAYRNTTLLGSSADDVFIDQHWQYLEVKVTISATVGEVTARINGTQVLNLTSQNTKNVGDYIRYFVLRCVHNDNDSLWDDLYVDDSQFHGDCRIKTFVPDSVSSTNNDFTASAGNKDDCVDEAPPTDDTDYIYSDTLNDKQTFGITTGSLGTVIGIQLNNLCRVDAGGDRKITPLIRSNSTNYSGTEIANNVPANFKFESEIFETDPDDSSAWTQTKLEAAEFGLEITT
jgi:hypothetical protein